MRLAFEASARMRRASDSGHLERAYQAPSSRREIHGSSAGRWDWNDDGGNLGGGGGGDEFGERAVV